MLTLSLVLLRQSLRRANQVVVDPEIVNLLDLLAHRDLTTHRADRLEAVMLRQIGSPAVVAIVGNQPTPIASYDILDGLVRQGLVTPADAERIGRWLTRRLQQWWGQASAIGLRGVRRRERRYAHQSRQLAGGILRRRAPSLEQIKVKLALLSATPSIEREHLIVLLDDLTRHH